MERAEVDGAGGDMVGTETESDGFVSIQNFCSCVVACLACRSGKSRDSWARTPVGEVLQPNLPGGSQ